PISALCLFPACVILRRVWVHFRRGVKGFCRRCGYDLRASAGRCPECGASLAGSARPRFRRALACTVIIILPLALGGIWLVRKDWSSPCRRIDFPTLGAFDMDQEHGTLADIPPSIRRLDGQQVELQGYM